MNLTEVVIRPNDKLEDLARKVREATILGTLQSTLTDFRYLSREWQRNCEEERLLGVSLTGIMDHPTLSGKGGDPSKWLQDLRDITIETNKEWSERLGINPSAAITTVKPSGTVSQLVGTSSGIHPAYARQYIRNVRNSWNDPLTRFLQDQGVPMEQDVRDPTTYVIGFPIKVPEHSVLREDMSAIDQLELWKTYQEHWCEHKPSCTVYVREEEWMEVGAWVYNNFEIISGVSFLPYSDHIYKQAPYEPIDEERYQQLVDNFGSIDWDQFIGYEEDDNTTSSQELACSGGMCEII